MAFPKRFIVVVLFLQQCFDTSIAFVPQQQQIFSKTSSKWVDRKHHRNVSISSNRNSSNDSGNPFTALFEKTKSSPPPPMEAPPESNLVKVPTTDENDEEDDAFSFWQRIESLKCVIVGALSGSIAVAPITLLHDGAMMNSMAQFEFDTDAAALEGALFAIVYRYVIREDENDMLNMGCIGAFIIVRTLSRISIPTYCTAIPLTCGSPFGYVDYDILSQLAVNGVESAFIFYGAAKAIDFCIDRQWISKFP